MLIADKIENKEAKIAVIGLGYVGLPIALEFARKYSVIGFDINEDRVDLMKQGIDPSEELEKEEFDGCDIEFTANIEDLKAASFYVVAVPTPIDEHKLPNLGPVKSASKTVGQVISRGDYVIFESTVYPGCTEEDCVPVIEEVSGLKFQEDFSVGYSPERINPGDKEHTLTKIVKVVSGNSAVSSKEISRIYANIITAGVHEASSIKVAEASKIIENTQRDVNIALMNELSMIFDKVGINTFEVLEAARTKWNFLGFFPGLVGGHCIGVDPYYLTYKAKELGYHSKVITSGRDINDSMGAHVARKTVKMIIAKDKNIKNARVLIMGATFKENVSDIRNSKVVDVIDELKSFGANVDVIDPLASSKELDHEYGFGLTEAEGTYDAVIVAVNHIEYVGLSKDHFEKLLNGKGIFIDIKGIYKEFASDFEYWSL